MSKKIYAMITNQIIQKLEQGTIPWRNPFTNGFPVNWLTQKPYRGINLLLLESGEYATYKQIQDAGGSVKKGAKGKFVVFWKILEFVEEDQENQENKKKIPLLRYYKVFKVGEQTEGIRPKRILKKESELNPIEQAEAIIKGYNNPPTVTHDSRRAYYRKNSDVVNVPPMKDFDNIHHYYSVFFHELIHSTGHKDRLNRPGIVNLETNGFGTESYSKEELIAELGAAMLCGLTEIENHTIDNNAAYIKSWLSALENDHTLIVQAAQHAQKAADYIQGKNF
ncbi:zincin-like metallopeptidase domain-containing protein [Bacillus sp. FSL R5-0654]|uniref:ArdC family protein n=1 Tax=Bacillus TaxID=1386 RepID=UPI0030FC5D7E